jgi:stringent starvation protein B
VMAIYARENGQGMSFPMSPSSGETVPVQKKTTPARPVLSAVETSHAEGGSDDEPPTPTSPSGRPSLTRVK